LSLGGSSPYTSTDKTNDIYVNETIQKHSTNIIKHSKYKYTYYQNFHTLQNPYTHTHTHTHPIRVSVVSLVKSTEVSVEFSGKVCSIRCDVVGRKWTERRTNVSF
jgi:hypothetical protein